MAKRQAAKAVIPKAMKSSAVGKVISSAVGFMGKGGKGKKRHKKSAMWYAKEIQRLKLKKRFEKVKLGVLR